MIMIMMTWYSSYQHTCNNSILNYLKKNLENVNMESGIQNMCVCVHT